MITQTMETTSQYIHILTSLKMNLVLWFAAFLLEVNSASIFRKHTLNEQLH